MQSFNHLMYMRMNFEEKKILLTIKHNNFFYVKLINRLILIVDFEFHQIILIL